MPLGAKAIESMESGGSECELIGFSVAVLEEEWEDEGGSRAASDDAVGLISGTGEEGEAGSSSGLAMRRPPRVSARLMSPFIAVVSSGACPGVA